MSSVPVSQKADGCHAYLKPTERDVQDLEKDDISKGPQYTNLAPWSTKLFFAHTYYVYITVFYMFLLLFYKGYALEYPNWRRPTEMVMIMFIPVLHHTRFYFGHWGCEKGVPSDLAIFLVFCALVMWMQMYFLFKQAYILPMDQTLNFIAIIIIIVEGMVGTINALQAIKLRSSTTAQAFNVMVGIVLFLIAVIAFIAAEIHPTNEHSTRREQRH
eukprot:gnl/TRDRNA2_/TRDRNA2_84294_c0_seq1.p2 gnl/TRDRNA2_/TRDRNA2_84294_c0~~gnl/TRDRNA2_/TRDRNA2_84294_c0_seq1.p2  ORF type:complete len:215 (+),score=48.41 gnl/TRDRNA2_/TRDRNA2_84294_c0_seq1:51-695(+)